MGCGIPLAVYIEWHPVRQTVSVTLHLLRVGVNGSMDGEVLPKRDHKANIYCNEETTDFNVI